MIYTNSFPTQHEIVDFVTIVVILFNFENE